MFARRSALPVCNVIARSIGPRPPCNCGLPDRRSGCRSARSPRFRQAPTSRHAVRARAAQSITNTLRSLAACPACRIECQAAPRARPSYRRPRRRESKRTRRASRARPPRSNRRSTTSATAIVSRRSIKRAAIFSAIGSSDCMVQAAPFPSWQSTRNTPTSALANCFASARAEHSRRRFGAAYRPSGGFDFLVAAAQLFLHRDRLPAGSTRDPDFASGNGRIRHQLVERALQRAVIRRPSLKRTVTA